MSEPGFIADIVSVNIRESAETKSGDTGWIDTAVDSHTHLIGSCLVSLSHLHVHFIIGNWTPVLRNWKRFFSSDSRCWFDCMWYSCSYVVFQSIELPYPLLSGQNAGFHLNIEWHTIERDTDITKRSLLCKRRSWCWWSCCCCCNCWALAHCGCSCMATEFGWGISSVKNCTFPNISKCMANRYLEKIRDWEWFDWWSWTAGLSTWPATIGQ